MTLFAHVAAHLEAAAVRFGVVGAAAMAVHGISRSTFDIDLAVGDRDRLTRAVDVAVSQLPESSRTLWAELKQRGQ